ncbi:hypothetical protein EMPG_17536 [Blastomyces silverae]|uniref:Uncharacterized protein n=1 Tax=Blastomyces silverae TaxID=2060906 RepID=A0A0H1B7B3_9EURO|nr:hypothetical protein EMPG_17536 [Blastomyces silverae]
MKSAVKCILDCLKVTEMGTIQSRSPITFGTSYPTKLGPIPISQLPRYPKAANQSKLPMFLGRERTRIKFASKTKRNLLRRGSDFHTGDSIEVVDDELIEVAPRNDSNYPDLHAALLNHLTPITITIT